MSNLKITFEDDGRKGRYVTHVEGHDAEMTFVHAGESKIIADHTLVPPPIGGRGIAAEIVTHAVEDARARGWKIHPTCSYVVAQFKRHPEWADVLAK